MTNINNRAYRSLHKFSLNKDIDNSNNLAQSKDTTQPTQGTPIKRFWTHQPIVPPPTSINQDTVTLQTPDNSNSLYRHPGYTGPTIETKELNRSSALNALHQEHPEASSSEMQELLRKRLKANFLDFS